MSNLSNLFISSSYKGLINLEDSTLPLSSQTGDINLQDGEGENVGLKINAQTKKFTVVNDLQVDGNIDLNGDVDISGSLVFTGSLDISGNLSAQIGTFDTVNTRILHVTEESASVIFSSGSNVLGDEPSDTQILSGSVYIPNLEYLAGNVTDTNTRINNKVDTTTFNSFTSSINNRVDSLETSFETYTSSVDNSLSHLNSSTASLNAFSSSADQRLDSLEAFTGSLVTNFVTAAQFNSFTSSTDSSLASINAFTASADGRLNNIELTTASLQSEVDGLSSKTGSYATTGSNTFDGTQIYSGSVSGEVSSITIASSTASMDCSVGNFFTLVLPAGVNTEVTATNITPGLTLTLQISQPVSGTGTATFSTDKLRFPRLNQPSVTPQSSAIDVATFVSFDSNKLNGILSNELI
tara:strand:+ start:11631 stop:12860 length:1230 start_codon:yes stop_codon:yes gene_type:complete